MDTKTVTKQELIEWLKDRKADLLYELKEVAGIDGRTYRTWDPDMEYAETEVLDALCDEIDWDQTGCWDNILSDKFFQEVVRLQGIYNMAGF